MGVSQQTEEFRRPRFNRQEPNAKNTVVSGPTNIQEAKNIPEALIYSTTWTRESHGLFDFEGKEIVSKQFRIKGSHRIFRTESDV